MGKLYESLKGFILLFSFIFFLDYIDVLAVSTNQEQIRTLNMEVDRLGQAIIKPDYEKITNVIFFVNYILDKKFIEYGRQI